MGLREENFEVTAHLSSLSAVKIQTVLNALDSTPTKIKLENPEEGGNKVDFELKEGAMSDVDDCCEWNDVTRSENTLVA